MAEFIFKQLQYDWPTKWVSGTYLWIWNPDKIPPHIGISRGQNYFSLTYRQSELQKNVQSLVRKTKRGKLPLVLVDLSDWSFQLDFTTVFQQFECAKEGVATCLTPIKAIMGMGDEILQLADLLKEIERRGKLKQVFAVNLETTYRGILDYSVDEIMRAIKELHEAKRSESTITSR